MAGSGPRGDSGYEVAQLFSRFHKEVWGTVGSEDSELTWSQRKQAITHTYQLARLYPYADSAADKLGKYVIGPAGVWPKPQTTSDAWNDAAAAKFKAHFDDPRLCDVRNRQTLPDMLRHMVAHAILFTGDGGFRMLPGLKLNPYESDRIGPAAGRDVQPADEVQGVQLTPWGEFTGFRVGQRANGGVKPDELVPASEFIFCPRYLPHRFDQVRGVGALMQTFSRFIMAGEITTAELRAMLAAAKIAFYQPVDGLDGIEVPKDASGNPIYPRFQLQDGTVLYGPPGHEPKTFKSDRPNSNFESMLRNVWTETASLLGMSYEVLTGDWSKANFSIFRGVRMTDQESIADLQGWVRKTILDRLFYWSTSYWIKTGELDPAPVDRDGDAANYLVSWSWPKLEHIDPYKEEQANRLHLENAGTLRDIYGDSWREKIRERAREVRAIKEEAAAASTDGIEVTPDEIMRPISTTRSPDVAAAAPREIADNGSEPTR